jgi:hypothetical protein
VPPVRVLLLRSPRWSQASSSRPCPPDVPQASVHSGHPRSTTVGEPTRRAASSANSGWSRELPKLAVHKQARRLPRRRTGQTDGCGRPGERQPELGTRVRLASALPCPAGRSVPGRGGPERRRRPRPDGTGSSVRAGSVAHRDHRGTSGHQRSPTAKRSGRSTGLQLKQLAQRQLANQIVVPKAGGTPARPPHGHPGTPLASVPVALAGAAVGDVPTSSATSLLPLRRR